jgi:hypothetical protein
VIVTERERKGAKTMEDHLTEDGNDGGPIRVVGVVPGADGRLVEVAVEVPPGPVAETLTAGAVRGLSLADPGGAVRRAR